MQLARTRSAEKLVPSLGAEPDDARQAGIDVPKLDGAYQSGKTCKEAAQLRIVAGVGPCADHQEDGGLGKRPDHWLWKHDFVQRFGCVHSSAAIFPGGVLSLDRPG